MQEAPESHIVVFKNITSADPDAWKVVSDLIHNRVISSKYIWNNKKDYSGVIFAAVHNPGLFANQVLSPEQISKKVYNYLFPTRPPCISIPIKTFVQTKHWLSRHGDAFDAVIPFVLEGAQMNVNGSSNGGENLYVCPLPRMYCLSTTLVLVNFSFTINLLNSSTTSSTSQARWTGPPASLAKT